MFFYELQVTFHNSFFTNPFWGTACEIFCLLRSSRSEVFCKKGVVRNFEKFIGKHLCQSLLFNKVAGLRPASLLKKRLWHWCFPVNFAKFLRTPFLIENLRWLLVFAGNNFLQILSFPHVKSYKFQYWFQ